MITVSSTGVDGLVTRPTFPHLHGTRVHGRSRDDRVSESVAEQDEMSPVGDQVKGYAAHHPLT